MNAEWPSLVVVALLALASPAHAGVVEAFVLPQDPLLTAPGELKEGVPLPGDDAPAACPSVKDFSIPLTLAEAVDLALCNNTRIKAAWADIKAEAAATGVARAAYLPSLSGSISSMHDTVRFPGAGLPAQNINTTPISATFAWRLFDFGLRGANHDAAMQALAAALASHDAVLQQTLATVVQSYADAQIALSAWQAKGLSEKIARSTLESARRREAKGAGTSGDTLQATTALAWARMETNRTQGGYQKAMTNLSYDMGIPPYTHVTLAQDTAELGGQAEQGLEQWLVEAQRRHPAIVAAKARLQAAQYQVAAARKEGLPPFDFTSSYYEPGRLEQTASDTRSQEFVVGVTFRIPLFDGFAHSYKVHAASAQVERKAAELRGTEQQIFMDIVKAHADAVATLRNLDASGELLTAALEALQAAQRRYDKGEADILEILAAQTAFFEAQQEHIRSLAEWRSARLGVLASAGVLNRAELAR